MRVLVLHGPNLNVLGKREVETYGRTSLGDLNELIAARGRELGIDLEVRQSNREGELLEWIQGIPGVFDGLVINPAGYGHTSVALRDAVAALDIPVIEVHLSNIHAREPFRRHTLLSEVALGVIAGLGPAGYLLALQFLASGAAAGRKAARSG